MASPRSIPTLDRISALPDSVIHYILSFLSTKESAATSILSKRWKPLWLSVPTLDFDERNFTNFNTFRLFVYSVMLARDPTLPIRSFRLKCLGISSDFNPDDVNKFIDAAVQRGIQNLNLDMSLVHFSFKLPACVFSCGNLTVLKLKSINIYDLPDVNFPLLKTLHLGSIYFIPSGAHRFVGYGILKRLLSRCPNLEDLHATNLLIIPFQDEKFNGLHKLVRANVYFNFLNMPFSWVRNAKFLHTKLRQAYEYQVPTFPNLTHMEIVFQLTNDWLGKWNWLTKVLLNCPNLQNLTIHEKSRFGNEIAEGDWMDPPVVPECLSSQFKTCSLIAFKGMKCELQFAEYILKNAKALHTMKVSASPMDLNTKLQILMKLSLCPRGSTACKLSFD